jgi:hypothetical protein
MELWIQPWPRKWTPAELGRSVESHPVHGVVGKWTLFESLCRLRTLLISMACENLDSRLKGQIADLSTPMAFGECVESSEIMNRSCTISE